jgi:tape measure domain-containing protein
MAQLQIKIDPTQAVQGARTIRKEIEWVEDAAEGMEAAVGRARDELGRFTKAGNDAAGGARVFKRSADEMSQSADRARDKFGRFVGGANDNFDKLNTRVATVTGTFRTLISVLGPLAGLFSVNALVQYADAWSDMQSRVGAAVKDMEAAPRLMQRMVDIANASYSPLSQTVEVYSRNVAVLRDLGRGASEAADFTEALNHALVLTATRGERAASVQNALSKAMAVGKLQADGLETILANGGEVAQALADELGTSVNGLRAMASQGKITGDVIANALITRLDDLRDRAKEMPATIGDAFVRIGTNLTALIGQMDQATGTSAAIADALISFADNLDRVAIYAGTAAVAFGTYFVAAFVAANLATLTLAGSLAFLRAALIRTGIGLAVIAAGELVYQFTQLVDAAGGFGNAMSLLGDVAYEVWDRIKLDAYSLGLALHAVWESMKGKWFEALAAMQERWANFVHNIAATMRTIPGMEETALAWSESAIRAGSAFYETAAAAEEAKNKAKELAQASEDAAEAALQPLESIAKIRDVLSAASDAARNMSDGMKEAGGAARPVAQASAEYTKLIDTAQRRVDQLQEEIGLVGKAGLEADALRFKYDLLAQAKEQNIKLGPEERAKIDELTESYRRLSEQLAALEALDQINFERSLIGLSDGDQKIVGSLRQWGIDINSAQGQVVAGQMRVNQVMQQSQDEIGKMHDLGKDAFMSILDLLYETGDIGDKLIGIFAQLGKQFAQMGMEKLWKQFSGEGSSMFDGAMGAIASWPEMAGGGRGGWSPVASQQVGQAIGQSIAPSITTSLNSGLQTYAAAIRKIESGSFEGNYSAVGKRITNPKSMYYGDQALGAYQVMGKNVAAWTKEATGVALTQKQFLNDRAAQDKVFATRAMQAFDKFGNWVDAGSVWFTGGPVSSTKRNPGDGNTSVPSYLSQLQSNMDTYSGMGLKQGVSDGMIDATRKIAHMPDIGVGAAAVAPGVAGQPQQGGGMFGGMNMNTMMAGVGAFAGGMQSGDPLGGAIGGGLGMLGAGAGPLGIAAGAVLGLVGGLIGKAKQKKEELKKARQELEQQMGAITDLIARATGNFMGGYQSALMQTSDEFAKAIALAEKAKNTKLTKELNDAQDEFFDNMADRWQRNFDGMIASMESGMSFDSAYMAGMDAVEKMRETLVGFVNDAKMFSEAGDDLAGWLTDLKGIVKENGLTFRHMDGITELPEFFSGGINVSQDMKDAVERWKAEIEQLGVKVFNEGVALNSSDPGTPITAVYETVDGLRDKLRDLGVEFNEQGEILRAAADANGAYADQVEQARQAAIKTALAAISGADEFTAMEEAVDKANGAAKNMESLLGDLGMSAEDAARAIESHLNIAMAKMRDAYRDELSASINDLSGFGFINEIVDAHKLYEDRLRDATKLGLDGSMAMKELNLSLQSIVSSSSLTQAEIDMLAAAWPAMAGLIEAVAGKDAMAMVAEAESALRAAYEKQKSEIEATINRLERFTDTIKRFREEMRVNASSPLSQREQMEEALKLYRETAASAMSGDEDAQERLTSVSQSALDEARAYYASSEEYAKIWREIDTTLELVERSAGRQLSEAQQQLEALNKQVGALIDINESVLSVEEAIAALANATSARDRQMQDQINAAKGSGIESKNAQIAEMYRSILGRSGRDDEIAWWANSGKSIDTIRADIEFAKLHGAMKYGGIVGAYANGGMVGNGLYNVDSVVAKYAGGGDILLAGGEHVTRAPSVNAATMPILDHINATGRPPNNDNSDLVAEVRALRVELAELKAGQREHIAVTATTGQQTADAVERGNKNTNEMKSALRKVASAAA